MSSKRSIQLILAGTLAAGSLALSGCVQLDQPTRTSTQELTGHVPDEADLEDAEIVTVDEEQNRRVFATDENGDFRLELPSGHTYEVYVAEEGERGLDEADQLVFPRSDGWVDRTITVSGEMAPFDLGEVRPAGTLETAEYHVAEAAERDEERPDAPERDSLDEADERVECEEGPAGLFCVHDGIHPGCEGLSIAAEKRAAGMAHADRTGSDQDAELPEIATDHIPEDPESSSSESEERPEPIDLSQPVALAQFNPPFEFPGCGAE